MSGRNLLPSDRGGGGVSVSVGEVLFRNASDSCESYNLCQAGGGSKNKKQIQNNKEPYASQHPTQLPKP